MGRKTFGEKNFWGEKPLGRKTFGEKKFGDGFGGLYAPKLLRSGYYGFLKKSSPHRGAEWGCAPEKLGEKQRTKECTR